MSQIKWILPTDLIEASVAIMRPQGSLGCEGLALWFGRAEDNLVKVTYVVAVHGPGFQSAPLQLRLSLRAFEKLTDLSDQVGAFLVGQIHSHPGRLLGLSLADTVYGIRRQDYLSLVCPYYAQRDTANVAECGAHVFDQGEYRRLLGAEVERRILVTQSRVILLTCEVPA